MGINVKVVVPNYRSHHLGVSEFMMIAERDPGGQYMLCVDWGHPQRVVPVEGCVAIFHEFHAEFHLVARAESMGENDMTIDPICAAVIKKGWSTNLINMRVKDFTSQPRYQIAEHLVGQEQAPIKPAWDGSSERYIIAPPSVQMGDWSCAIHSHWDDHHYLVIYVLVPDIYQKPDQLEWLIQAINGLPNAKDVLPPAHPAMLHRPG